MVYRSEKRRERTSSLFDMANRASDLSPLTPDSDFFELLWENGQIVVQSQSSRPKSLAISAAHPSQYDSTVPGKDDRSGCTSKNDRYDSSDIGLPEIAAAPATAGENVGWSTAHDDANPVSWYSDTLDASLPSEYYSEFLPEPLGSGLNSLHPQNGNLNSISQNSRIPDAAENMNHFKALEGGKTESVVSKQLNSVEDDAQRVLAREGESLTSNVPNQQVNKLHQPSNGASLLNFAHFSLPVALAKANLESMERSKNNGAAGNRPSESTVVIQSKGGFRRDSNRELAPAQRVQETAVAKPSHALQEMTGNSIISKVLNSHSMLPNSNKPMNGTIGKDATEKCGEAFVAPSSMCSGNGVGAVGSPKHRGKRRIQEDSGSQDEVEDRSGKQRKSANNQSPSTKRSRTAEVHNLSERRRRDRINERMRALQELIPNCNKADKASMLDEAIEYLKTLQLQVQMMSMGTGLCIPPMVVPHGIQHFRMPTLPHFSQIGPGIGMNMRTGHAMGVLDMNGSPGCSFLPVPSLHGAQFPCPVMPGYQNLNPPPGSSSLLFGIQGQGMPPTVPRVSPSASFPGLPAMTNSTPQLLAATADLLKTAVRIPIPMGQQHPVTNTDLLHTENPRCTRIPTVSQAGENPATCQLDQPDVNHQMDTNSSSTCGTDPSRTTGET